MTAHPVQDADATDDEIEESQASQSATSMLRLDPRKSMDVLPSPTHATEKSGLLQSKLFGSVSKPGVEKRKGEGEGSSAKRLKTAEGVGLGIGIAR